MTKEAGKLKQKTKTKEKKTKQTGKWRNGGWYQTEVQCKYEDGEDKVSGAQLRKFLRSTGSCYIVTEPNKM